MLEMRAGWLTGEGGAEEDVVGKERTEEKEKERNADTTHR